MEFSLTFILSYSNPISIRWFFTNYSCNKHLFVFVFVYRINIIIIMLLICIWSIKNSYRVIKNINVMICSSINDWHKINKNIFKCICRVCLIIMTLLELSIVYLEFAYIFSKYRISDGNIVCFNSLLSEWMTKNGINRIQLDQTLFQIRHWNWEYIVLLISLIDIKSEISSRQTIWANSFASVATVQPTYEVNRPKV